MIVIFWILVILMSILDDLFSFQKAFKKKIKKKKKKKMTFSLTTDFRKNWIVAVYDFHDFVCSLFPKAILFDFILL